MATTSGSLIVEPTISTAPEQKRSVFSKRAGLTWMIIACVLVGTAGYLRNIQDRRLTEGRMTFQPCPFRLEDLPEQIGSWSNKPGVVQRLDDKTVQITGSTDHLIRTYVDSMTGSQFSLLVLYGPAEPVLPHTPDVCYPATGFTLDGSIGQTGVTSSDGQVTQFRTATYSRPGRSVGDRVRVYYSFRHDDAWSPTIGSGMKFHRSNPGIFKVQIARPMWENERATKNEPIEKFLSLLLPEIERRIQKTEPTSVIADNKLNKPQS